MINRPRRNRLTSGVRGLIRETNIQPRDLVWPTFVQEGNNLRTPIGSMPGVSRLSIDQLVVDSYKAFELGIPAVALFPAIDDSLKNSEGKESLNPNGLLQRAVKKLKKEIPDMIVITDVALDPYSSDGHDGFVQNGQILNDETLPLLAGMAVSQAKAGADVVAPSDMMDGRVEAIRLALDDAGFHIWNMVTGAHEAMKKNGVGVVVAKTTNDFLCEANTGELLIINSGFTRLGNKSLTYTQRMTNAENGALIATQDAVEVFFDLKARKSTYMPNEIRQILKEKLVSVDNT